MKLKKLQEVINSELILVTVDGTFTNVYKYGGIFYKYCEKEVIGIRSVNNFLEVSVKWLLEFIHTINMSYVKPS